MTLVQLFEEAKGTVWIAGRPVTDDCICIRITEEDREEIVRALRVAGSANSVCERYEMCLYPEAG